MTLYLVSWVAIALLSVSYWFQIYKIHVHKEVRDISITYYILLSLGFGILAITAYSEGSVIFFVKQIMTTVPSIIIVLQVLYHRNDIWHDPHLKNCNKCSHEIEGCWKFCPYCGDEDAK